jgi:hypothetical protein
MHVDEARAILTKKFPDKKFYGNPVEFKGQFSFSMVSKDFVEGTPNYDNTIYNVNPKTGEVSICSFFDLDFLDEAKSLTKSELF